MESCVFIEIRCTHQFMSGAKMSKSLAAYGERVGYLLLYRLCSALCPEDWLSLRSVCLSRTSLVGLLRVREARVGVVLGWVGRLLLGCLISCIWVYIYTSYSTTLVDKPNNSRPPATFPPTYMRAGGKPSTWFTPGGLAEQSYTQKTRHEEPNITRNLCRDTKSN